MINKTPENTLQNKMKDIREKIQILTEELISIKKENPIQHRVLQHEINEYLNLLYKKLKILKKNLCIYKNLGEKGLHIGKKFVIETQNGEIKTFTIVLPEDSDPKNNCISVSSPMGKAIINNQEYQNIQFDSPKGKTQFKILLL